METSQTLLLRNNYKNHRSKEVLSQDSDGIVIEVHDRDMGREAFYAVHDGIPVAYCVGHRVRKKNRQFFCIKSTFVHPDWQQKGIGTKIYENIARTGRVIISDYELSDGARKLWTRLSQGKLRVVRIGKQFIAFQRKDA